MRATKLLCRRGAAFMEKAVGGTSISPVETTDLCSSSPTSFVAVKVHWTKASGQQRAGCTATFKLRATMIPRPKCCIFNKLYRRNEVPFAPALSRFLSIKLKN
jgi:hypothetical protein